MNILSLTDPYHPDAQALAVNQSLSDNAAAHRINEPFLIERFESLLAYPPANGELFWLTLARITEMTLFCAGNYADSGEIQAAGSLLVNPRQVLVHIRGRSEPILKKRDQSMSEQFQALARGRDVREWLKQNTRLEVVQPPLLPQLTGFMIDGGRFRSDYLESVKGRACRVSDTMNLIASSLAGQDMDFAWYLAVCRPENRDFLEAGLCRFDLDLFWELEQEVQTVVSCNLSHGRFLDTAPAFHAGPYAAADMASTAAMARSIS
jgi:hypothetical protein